MKTHLLAGVALAICTAGTICPQQAVAAQQQQAFSIPAGDLKTALDAYVQQSGRQLIYPADQVRGVRSPGARGNLSADEALSALLAGTGFVTRRDPSGAIAIVSAEGNVPPAADRQPETGVAAGTEGAEGETIIVTGTNIRGVRNPISNVVVLDKEGIELTGRGTVAEVLETVPQNVGGGKTSFSNTVFAGADSLNFSGGAGADLRGLGNSSTLTLVNGRRLAPAGFGDFVDLSAIPLMAVERVEVLTDGASAIYGSDAVAGVVNMILEDRFEGVRLSGRDTFATEGDYQAYQLGALAGTDWQTGSALIAYNYSNQSNLDSAGRSFSENAPDQTDLIPDRRSHNVVARVSQDVSPSINLFAEGLYGSSKRNGHLAIDLSPFGLGVFHIGTHFQSKLFSGTGGARASFSPNWTGEFSVSYGEAKTHFENSGDSAANPFISKSKTTSADLLINGRLAELPGGSVRLAVGGQYRHEYYNSSGTNLITENPLSRDIFAGFGELFVPIVGSSNRTGGVEALEASVAGRIEHYSDFGTTANPQLGLKWDPLPGLSLRGTFGKSFHAPLLSQLDEIALINGQGLSTDTLVDPASPTGFTNIIFINQAVGNPDLQPEKSTSWSVGAEVTPDLLKGFRAKVTYFHYNFHDRIAQPIVGSIFDIFLDESLNAPFILRNPPLELATALFPPPSNPFANGCGCTPADIGAIVNGRLTNIARRKVGGLDFLVDYNRDVSFGRIGFTLNATHLFKVEDQAAPTVPGTDLVNTPYNPVSWRGRAGLTWSDKQTLAGLFVNFVGDYRDPRFDPVRHIDSWTTFDLSVSRTFPIAGGHSLRFGLSAQNLFNQDPPFVAEPPGGFLPNGINFDSTNADPIGRRISASLDIDW